MRLANQKVSGDFSGVTGGTYMVAGGTEREGTRRWSICLGTIGGCLYKEDFTRKGFEAIMTRTQKEEVVGRKAGHHRREGPFSE